MVLRDKPDGQAAFSGDRQGTWWGLVGGQPSSTAAWRCRQPAPQSCTRPTCPQCWGRRCAPPTAAQSIPSPAHTKAAALNKSPVGSRCSLQCQHSSSTSSRLPAPRLPATIPKSKSDVAGHGSSSVTPRLRNHPPENYWQAFERELHPRKGQSALRRVPAQPTS